MDDQAQSSILIHTRRGAILAFFIGILLSLRNFRYLFEFYVPGHTSWLTRYRFAPTNFSLIVDLCCAVLFTGAFIFVLRRSRGGERLYLLVWIGVVALSPLKDLHSAASVHAYEWLTAIADLSLIPIALRIYWALPARGVLAGAKVSD
ncbi:MAG: hypothetical protein ABSD44_16725 [Terracidiphilus sp.]